jgi:hypothetical protein
MHRLMRRRGSSPMTQIICKFEHPVALLNRKLAFAKISVVVAFICPEKRSYDVKSSMTLNTWFANCKMPIEKLLMLTYLISLDHSYENCIRETYDWLNDISISSATVAKHHISAREVIMCALGQRSQSR